MALGVSTERMGHIVALEGPSELVSTQLRLLPASRQIRILPSLQHYLEDTYPEAPFDARQLIHRYHTATLARYAEAQEFLRPSTVPDEKRLVFLHGGTMSAHAACLSTIMERETDGNIEEAHSAFIQLARNGVAGLASARRPYLDVGLSPSESLGEQADSEPGFPKGSRESHWMGRGYMDAEYGPFEDPSIRAMRAADALDKETEFLEEEFTPNVDLTVKLVHIPSRRSKKRLSSPASESAEDHRVSNPPSLQPRNSNPPAEPVSPVSPRTSPTEEPTSAAPRKPPLRIRIPSPPIPWAGDVAVGANRAALSNVYIPQRSATQRSCRGETKTAGPNLMPPLKPRGNAGPEDDGSKIRGLALPYQPLPAVPADQSVDAESRERRQPQASETEVQPFDAILPLLEDVVVVFAPETRNELHDFIFSRLSESCTKARHNILQGAGIGQVQIRDGQGVGEVQAVDGNVDGRVAAWMRKGLVHGLPTPNHSPTPLDESRLTVPLLGTRLYSINVGQECAVSIQNSLRSLLAARLRLQDRRYSDTTDELSASGDMWRRLECDWRVASRDGGSRVDLMLAVGAESGVRKSRLLEVVGQLEQLGRKLNGLSRSGRLDLRYLIANAMQAFTAQPLTKQTHSNPFADRALLAALIIPHLETYLATHPDVRFLLVEYPAEHLPTILALQALIGTDMMKVVGIINSDASSSTQTVSAPDGTRRPSEGFRSLNRWGSRPSGAFVGSCSFSKANFLLASSATGFETAAFVAAIRESLISISDFYIPERPLYRHLAPQSSPSDAYPSLNVNTKTAIIKPNVSEKEPSRVSVSTLIITPPSSPTETTPPAQVQPPARDHHILAPSSTSAGHKPFHGTKVDTMTTTIRWGEVNYTSSVHSVSPIASGQHRKKDSELLSPRRRRPPPMVMIHPSPPDREDDDDGDDEVQDEEERRLMPLYLRRREDVRRGGGAKALKWLGLV
ncbi:uncharacterized protein B0T15DRAFT_238250 [Chaetomium strumarium]|uniref:Gastric mucin-like protein n=1 Tax=Chaetomium strumarium TaxID=1170767 RepID=A0AAJ0M0D9_9PEZI|nr:hypothetical protein B0T15DRAFT_238250 [Chaetomium strumarium]